MKTLLITVGGSAIVAVIALWLGFIWLRGADEECRRTRAARKNEEIVDTHPHARTLEELIREIQKDADVNCAGAVLQANTLRCTAMLHCGLGSSLDGDIDFHVTKSADGTWSIVR